MNNEYPDWLAEWSKEFCYELKKEYREEHKNFLIAVVKEAERRGAIQVLEELANVDSVSFDDWMNNHYGLLNKLKNEQ